MNEAISGQLGNIVSWRVPSQVSLQALRDALVAAGLSADLAADMEPRNALSRALREMKQQRVIRRLQRVGDKLVFQINEVVEQGQHVVYPHEADVELDLPSGLVTCTQPGIERDARNLLATHLQTRITNDLTKLVQRVFESRKADLIPIREQGGAYFVPDQHSDLVNAARTLLDAIGGKLRSFSVRLGSADTAASVADSLSDYLGGLIAEFKASCEGVTGDSRSDVRARRQEAVGELRSKLECYRGLLGSFAEQIGAEIDASEQQLLAALLKQSEDNGASGGTGPAAGSTPARSTNDGMDLAA